MKIIGFFITFQISHFSTMIHCVEEEWWWRKWRRRRRRKISDTNINCPGATKSMCHHFEWANILMIHLELFDWHALALLNLVQPLSSYFFNSTRSSYLWLRRHSTPTICSNLSTKCILSLTLFPSKSGNHLDALLFSVFV